MNPKDIESEIDDLIMRMKDCISHEDKHGQHFTDRCITKVQFKQLMKALLQDAQRESRYDELEQVRIDILERNNGLISLGSGLTNRQLEVLFSMLNDRSKRLQHPKDKPENSNG